MDRLVLQSLSFAYGRRGQLVVDQLSWEPPRGRSVLLGPNGAGKSTLLGLAADALKPRSGRRRFGKSSPDERGTRKRYRRAIGWMPQHVRPIAGLTLREQVSYVGWLKGMTKPDAWNSAPAALERVGLLPLSDRRGTSLSGGQLRRLGLAQSLVHGPAVILLDEPTAGLDPAQRARFRRILGDLDPEITVIVSTHQVDDLGELFDHVAVMDSGRFCFQGAVSEFMSAADGGTDNPRRAEMAYSAILPAGEM